MLIKAIFTAQIKNALPDVLLSAVRLASEKQDGFLGMISSEKDGVEETISYWRDEEAVQIWAKNEAHCAAKKRRDEFYYWTKLKFDRVSDLPENISCASIKKTC